MMSVLSNKIAARSAMLTACETESGSRRKLLKSHLAGWSVQDICTSHLNRYFYRGRVPQDKPTRNSLFIKGLKTFIKRLRWVEYMTLKGIRSGTSH